MDRKLPWKSKTGDNKKVSSSSSRNANINTKKKKKHLSKLLPQFQKYSDNEGLILSSYDNNNNNNSNILEDEDAPIPFFSVGAEQLADVIKCEMQDNLSSMLGNTEETFHKKLDQLNKESNVFIKKQKKRKKEKRMDHKESNLYRCPSNTKNKNLQTKHNMINEDKSNLYRCPSNTENKRLQTKHNMKNEDGIQDEFLMLQLAVNPDRTRGKHYQRHLRQQYYNSCQENDEDLMKSCWSRQHNRCNKKKSSSPSILIAFILFVSASIYIYTNGGKFLHNNDGNKYYNNNNNNDLVNSSTYNTSNGSNIGPGATATFGNSTDNISTSSNDNNNHTAHENNGDYNALFQKSSNYNSSKIHADATTTIITLPGNSTISSSYDYTLYNDSYANSKYTRDNSFDSNHIQIDYHEYDNTSTILNDRGNETASASNFNNDAASDLSYTINKDDDDSEVNEGGNLSGTMHSTNDGSSTSNDRTNKRKKKKKETLIKFNIYLGDNYEREFYEREKRILEDLFLQSYNYASMHHTNLYTNKDAKVGFDDDTFNSNAALSGSQQQEQQPFPCKIGSVIINSCSFYRPGTLKIGWSIWVSRDEKKKQNNSDDDGNDSNGDINVSYEGNDDDDTMIDTDGGEDALFPSTGVNTNTDDVTTSVLLFDLFVDDFSKEIVLYSDNGLLQSGFTIGSIIPDYFFY